MSIFSEAMKSSSDALKSARAKINHEIRMSKVSMSHGGRSKMDRMEAALEYVESRDDVSACERCDNYIHDECEDAVEYNGVRYCHPNCMQNEIDTRNHEDTGRTI